MQMTKKKRSLEPAVAKLAENIPTEFVLDKPEAHSVAVAGNFNNWKPSQTPLRQIDCGLWRTEVPLPAGRYEYRFVVDGQWLADPGATESTPNAFGSVNSIKLVKPPTAPSSPLLLAPPETNRRTTLRSG